jgi:hypothetical protein
VALPTTLYTQEMQKGSPGNDLLSQGPTSQVPSALEGLTSWFGMEQGVSPPLESPEEPSMPFFVELGTLKTEQDVWRKRKLTYAN